MTAANQYTEQEYEDAVRNSSNYVDQYGQQKEKYHFQRWLVDDQQEILDLQYALRGIVWDEKENKYLQLSKYRVMSDIGARKLTDLAFRLISKGGKLSRFTDDEVMVLMRDTMHTLLIHLHLNYELYEMEYNDLDLVLDTFDKNLYSIFKRAVGGMEQERLMTTGKIISEERGTIQENNQLANRPYDDAYLPQKPKKFGVF